MKFGLIGHPIAHSLSPYVFKAGYNGLYPYDLIETPDFEEAYSIFMRDYDGINVTAPFKELALQKAEIISEECKLIRATNLLVKTPEGIKAYNSDYRGVKVLLSEISDDPKEATVLIVGLGGAGKATVAAAQTLGYKTILMNRTQYSPEVKPLSEFRNEFRNADVIIYNLPVRIPEIDLLTVEDFGYGHAKIILEANYRNPSFDDGFMQRMHDANPHARYIHGREWLLQQAVTGYEIFTGDTPDFEAMKAVIKSK